MTLSSEQERDIFQFLRLQNCCLRCSFRFLGCRTQEYYEEPIRFATSLGYVTNESNHSTKETPCASCLGILQDHILETVIHKVQTKVQEEAYDCETFTCALTVPVCIAVREHALQFLCATELEFLKDVVCTFKLNVQNVKDVWKWLVIPKLEQAIKKRADLTTPSPFLIEVFLTYKDDDRECEALFAGTGMPVNMQKKKCHDYKFSRKNIEGLLSRMTDKKCTGRVTPAMLESTLSVNVGDVICSHSSIFIGGRYNKLSRQLSQTPWLINGEKKMESSVQEILCSLIAVTVKAESIKFLSSGREDVDVRNIYSGRPFAVELVNPKMTNIPQELLSRLAKEINSSTEQVKIVSDLKVLSKADLKSLKEGENAKKKFYRAVCVCRTGSKNSIHLERLTTLKRLKIIQKTPLRVLHRRPLSPRTRCIYEMRARWAEPHELQKLLRTADESADMFFVLDIKTQAGTYVKEFVHGDFGRTKPSLCDLLGAEVDIVALDVTGIGINWP